jgi:hypothetical protein
VEGGRRSLTVNDHPSSKGFRPRADAASRWTHAKGLLDDIAFIITLVRRRWLMMVIAVCCSGIIGFWTGASSPKLFQSETIILVRESSLPVSPYVTGAARNLSTSDLHQEHLLRVLRSEEVVRRALQDYDQAGIAALLGGVRLESRDHGVDRVRRQLVRVRVKRGTLPFHVLVRAGDSAQSARFSTQILSAADALVREKFRDKSWAQVRALEERLKTTSDPALAQVILEKIRGESERAILMGGSVMSIVSGPTVIEQRVTPKRKQLLALSLTSGFILALCVLLVSDPRSRMRFFAVKTLNTPAESLGPPQGGWLQDAASVLLLFAVFYNLSFKVMPSIPTARIALGLLFLFTLMRGVEPILGFIRQHFVAFLMASLLFAHAMTAYFTGGRETTQASRIAELIYLGMLGPFLYFRFVGCDWGRFHRHVMLATFAQTLLHIYSFLSLGFRQWVAGLLTQLGNYELTYAIVPPGFSNGAAAAFSVIQAIGVISTLVTLRGARSPWMILFCALIATLTLVSAGIAGRTGMIISLLMMLVFAWKSGNGLRLAVASALGSIVVFFVVFLDEVKIILNVFGEDLDWQLNSILKRSFEIFQTNGKVNSLQELAAMYIPPLNHETWFGTGIIRTIFGARHDSGYVQAYHALGLPMAMLFYGLVFLFVLRLRAALPHRPGRESWLFFWLIPVMFVLDVKEPFITHAITFYTVALLMAFSSGNASRAASPASRAQDAVGQP